MVIDAEFSAADHKIGSVSPDNYKVLGDAIRILDLPGTTQERFPEWYQFAAQYNTYPAGIAGEIRSGIHACLDPEAFENVLKDSGSFAQPDSIQGVMPVIQNLMFFTEDHPELLGTLWDYISTVLQSGTFADNDCYSWIVENSRFLQNIATETAISELKDFFADRCAHAIIQCVSNWIETFEIRDCAAFRAAANENIQNALDKANKFRSADDQKSLLQTQAENRIAAQLEQDLAALMTKVYDNTEQIQAVVVHINNHFIVLPPAGQYTESDKVREKVNSFASQLMNKYTDLIISDAESRIKQISTDDADDYRNQVQTILSSTVKSNVYNRNLSAWEQKKQEDCESHISNHVEIAFQALTQKVPTTADHFKSLCNSAVSLLQKLAPEGKYEQADNVRSRVSVFANQMKAKYDELMASTGMLIQKFDNKYFVGIQEYYRPVPEKNIPRKDTFTKPQQQEIENQLNALRPKDLQDYLIRFHSQTGKELNAGSLTDFVPGAAKVIAEDMRCLLSCSIPLDISGKSAGTLVEELDRYTAWAAFYGVPQSIRVVLKLADEFSFDEGSARTIELDAAMFRDILTQSLDTTDPSQTQYLGQIVHQLRVNKTLTDSQGFATMEMLCRCGCEAAADALFDELGGMNKTHIREKIANSMESEYAEKFSKKQLTIRNILLGVMSGLTIAAAGALVFTCLSYNKLNNRYENDMAAKEQAIQQLNEALEEEKQNKVIEVYIVKQGCSDPSHPLYQSP